MSKYEIIIYWSKDDDAFVAEVPELPGCMADGSTYQEALANTEIIVKEWIETANEIGRAIPEPKGRSRLCLETAFQIKQIIMRKVSFLLIIIALSLAAQTVAAQSNAEKDRASFISNAKVLERKPFDSNADKVRNWGFKWVADTDQVTVGLCGSIMKLIPEKKNKFKGELLMQMTFGMAVFKLENPDKKDDEKAAQLAGVESMLRTYEVMLAENEKAKNAELDSLVMKQKAGELKAIVDAAYTDGKCS